MRITVNHDVYVPEAAFERYRAGAVTFWADTEVSPVQRGDTLTMTPVSDAGVRVRSVDPLRFEVTDMQVVTFRVPVGSTEVTAQAFAAHIASIRPLTDGAADA